MERLNVKVGLQLLQTFAIEKQVGGMQHGKTAEYGRI
jgi:hypothetical protein